MTVFSERFTLATISACSPIGMLRWITPSPPSLARAMARPSSVTVSIADEMIGMFSGMSAESRVEMSTSAGSTPLRCGTRRTSSKLRPRGRSPIDNLWEGGPSGQAKVSGKARTFRLIFRGPPLSRPVPGLSVSAGISSWSGRGRFLRRGAIRRRKRRWHWPSYQSSSVSGGSRSWPLLRRRGRPFRGGPSGSRP